MENLDRSPLSDADEHVEAARKILAGAPDHVDLLDATEHLRTAITDILVWSSSVNRFISDAGVEIRDS
jgi:hypothetical protein